MKTNQTSRFTKGSKVLRVMKRYNPQLGCYATGSIETVAKVTSASVILDASYSNKFDKVFGEEKESRQALYGSASYKIYPVEEARKLIQEAIDNSTIDGTHTSYSAEYWNRQLEKLS